MISWMALTASVVLGLTASVDAQFERALQASVVGLHMLRSLQKPFRASDLRERWLQQLEPLPTIPKSAGPERSKPVIDLAEAIQKDWLELWYQPKINLKTLTVGGAEALIRARHPVHGVICPVDLLPPAGDPLYHPLSSFVLRSAMEDWPVFANKGYPLKLAINVPASALNLPAFVDEVRRAHPIRSKVPRPHHRNNRRRDHRRSARDRRSHDTAKALQHNDFNRRFWLRAFVAVARERFAL